MPKDIREFSLRCNSGITRKEDYLFYDMILMLSLNIILSISCQMIFSAMMGADLIVCNNDNLISVSEFKSNVSFNYYELTVQDILFNPYYDLINNMVLINCQVNENYNIHEFGFIYHTTIHFGSEEGERSEITIIKVDEDLNPLWNLLHK